MATLKLRQYYFFLTAMVVSLLWLFWCQKKFTTKAFLRIAEVPSFFRGDRILKQLNQTLLVYPTRISPELKARLAVAAANLETTPAALARQAIEQAVKLSESLETSKNPIA